MAPRLLTEAGSSLRQAFDPNNGGFGHAPKFPQASALDFLLRRDDLEVVTKSLRSMASGGIYDQVGGGFARYSVDAEWLVPHFEKMLYDNGLLARTYLHAWQVTADPLFRTVCEETLDWALREMCGPEGGFYSALDAASEGVEGKCSVWSMDELRELVGIEAAHWFGATEAGNFEGANILTRGDGEPEKLGEWRRKLYDVRTERVWPGLDDKRLCSWNALMISALADAGAVLEDQRDLDAATQCADFVLTRMRDENGRLLRTWKDGEGRLNAYLEDHAYLVEALLALYEATLEVRWFDAARETADAMIARFGDDERGGFFTTSNDHEELIARRKDVGDHPIPSGNSSATYGLLRLAALTGESSYEDRAVGTIRVFAPAALQHPEAFGPLLQAIDFPLSTVREIALIAPANGAGDAAALGELAGVVRSAHRPHVVLAGGPEGSERTELLRERSAIEGRPAAYVCEHFSCRAPVTEPTELADALNT